MEKVRLGRTELYVTKTSFGALPIQRISKTDAVRLVRQAYEAGINYFDTANMYTDSEEKLGAALHDVRQHVVISTKSGATDKKTALEHMELSLRRLRTDYIDLFQFHNPAVLPDIDDPNGAFAAALEMREKGYIRHIGITNHRLAVAREAIASGKFETLQFPFCYLASDQDLELVRLCREHDMGFIAMKGLSGGLLNNATACLRLSRRNLTTWCRSGAFSTPGNWSSGWIWRSGSPHDSKSCRRSLIRTGGSWRGISAAPVATACPAQQELIFPRPHG